MDGTLWAELLGERFDHVFVEGANVGNIRAWLQQGGIFEGTHRLIVINDGAHFWANGYNRARKMGAIKQLNIRTVDAELSVVH